MTERNTWPEVAEYIIARLEALHAQLDKLTPELQARLSLKCTETVLRLSQQVRARRAAGEQKH